MMETQDVQDLIEEYNSSPKNKTDLDQLIGQLKNIGISYINTVRILRELTGQSLSATDEIVLNSSSWIQEKKSIENIREIFFDAFSKPENEE